MAFHHMYCMVWIAYLFFTTLKVQAAPTDMNEIETLKIVLRKLGKTDWNFSGDPCINFQQFSCEYCDKNKNICHITNITLPSLNLNGVLPPELANLSHLVGLDISDNYLSSSIPREFGSIHALRNLSLSGNLLSGPIPKELGNLENLVELSLYSNKLNGSLPQEIGNLSALRNMYLSSNQFKGEIPPTFVKLQNLTELILQGTSLKGPIPSSIGNLIEMKYLRISDIADGGSSLDFINNLINLREIVLRNSNITTKIPDISNLMHLEALDLSFNNLYGDIPSSLKDFPNLQYLILGNNNLSGSNIPWLTDSNYKIIDLSYNKLNGNIPLDSASENSKRVNLIGNFLKSEISNDHSWIYLLQRNYVGNKQATNCRLAINCGGQSNSLVHGPNFDSDYNELNDSTFYLSPKRNWGVSNIGYLMKHYTKYTPELGTPHIVKVNNPPNSIDPQLYNTARTSPSSLRYYGLDLQNGPYNVTLHFAEIQFPASQNSEGVRIFDVYIQGKNVLKDFNIMEEAVEKNPVVVKTFTTSVTDNILEIHFFWAGKGACCESQEEIYGPLVSAITVDPEFKPHIPKNTQAINIAKIIVGVVGGLGTLLIISLIFIKKTKKWESILYFVRRDKGLAELKKMTGNYYSLKLMKRATHNFDPKNKIGEGGFGAVYKGILPGGKKVAIKQLSHLSKQGNHEFLTEVSTISAVQHPNLVKLYGCCVDGGELLLVYEYMENGNLAQALFDPGEGRVKLDWPTRYRICLGIARAIAYLHDESLLRIVHRDIKPTNILLDKQLHPKVADFGLARLFDEGSTHVSTMIAGTIGYMAPEYALKGHLSDKSDVYSFGVVVLEIVSGRTHTDMSLEEERSYLLEWAWQLYEEKKTLQLVDVNLLQSAYNEEEVVRMINVGLLCTQENPSARPCMSTILEIMKGGIATPAPQSQPGYLNQWLAWELAAGKHHIQAQSSATSKS